MTQKCLIIAEAGVNHNGSIKMARDLIRSGTEAKVDVVKFQTFRAETLAIVTAPKANYQYHTTNANESQFTMLKNLELSIEAHQELIQYCEETGVQYLSSAFDITAVDLLARLGQARWKIPSGEITNLPYLRKIGSLGQEVILSTGMADLGEIEAALNVLETAGTQRKNITVLHCNTEYPTAMIDVNLRAMQTISAAFPGVRVGYSDHTLGIEVPIAAVAMGAMVIEKHFSLDRLLPGPDHKASLEPDELSAMVRAIRNIELAIGKGAKRPSLSELKNKKIARKSIVAARNIKSGEIFTEQSLTVKRPAIGINPMRWDEIVGRTATRNYTIDEFIET